MKRGMRIVLSMVVGIAAAVVSLAYAADVRAQAEAAHDEALSRYGGETVEVCVARRSIDAGETVGEGDLVIEEWASSLLPEDAATSRSDVVGKVPTSRIPKRAVFCPTYFKASENAVDVPKGMVAVSVSADAAHAMGGSLAAGDAVDVYVSADGVADRLCAARVVDSSVLAAGGGDLSWVTLAVRPESVKELLSAVTRGAVTITVPAPAAGRGGDDA